MTDDPVDALLDLLHAEAEARGLSRAELARRMNVTPAYVSMVLSGTKNPTIGWLRRLWAVINA